MANSAFDHTAAITVPGSSTNTAIVTWTGTGADTFGNSTILVGSTTMGLAADTDLLTFGNGTLAITGAVTGVTALTASGAVTGGTLVGTVTTATQNSITTMTGLTTVGTVGTGVWNGTAIVQAYIGAEAINESKMQVSNAPTNGYVLTARDGVTGGFTWEAAAGGGLDSDADAIIHNGHGIVIGHTGVLAAADHPANTVGEFTMIGAAGGDTGIHVIRHAADAGGGAIRFAKSRNATVGSHTIVQDDDTIGEISFFGDDGGDFQPFAAQIRVRVDGTPGVGDMPGRIEFSTTADGAETPTERMRIQANGYIGIGTSAPERPLDLRYSQSRAQLRLARTGSATGEAALGAGDGLFSIMNGAYTRLLSVKTQASGLGDVGIGNDVPNTDARLHVTQTNAGNWVLKLDNDGGSGGHGILMRWRNHTADNNSDVAFHYEDSTALRFRVYSDGDVQNHDNSYGSTSDGRLKENIVDARPALPELAKLRMREFSWISDGLDTADLCGVVAQEVLEAGGYYGGHFIKENGEGYYGAYYSQLVPMLVKAVQELKAEIDELKG